MNANHGAASARADSAIDNPCQYGSVSLRDSSIGKERLLFSKSTLVSAVRDEATSGRAARVSERATGHLSSAVRAGDANIGQPTATGFTAATTSVGEVCQRRNTAYPCSLVAPLTSLAVAASSHAATGFLPRPIAHGQFRLLPVPLDRDPEWNARIAAWARS